MLLNREENDEGDEEENSNSNTCENYEVIVPHGIQIGEKWVEYGEILKGSKNIDDTSTSLRPGKIYVELRGDDEDETERGWVDRSSLMLLV